MSKKDVTPDQLAALICAWNELYDEEEAIPEKFDKLLDVFSYLTINEIVQPLTCHEIREQVGNALVNLVDTINIYQMH